MKKFAGTLLVLFIYVTSFSQARVTVTDYQKVQQPAVENEISFPEKTVSKAIQERLEKSGYKGKDSKGFIVYRGVKLPELGPDNYDLYFKTDRKSKKEKDITVVTLMITKGTDSFLSEATDPGVINSAKNYLESFRPVVVAYDLEQQIIDQEDAVKKADKKLNNLKEDASDMEKKKKKLEQDIADNIKDQESQVNEVAKQKKVLETLISQRKQ